MSRSSWPRTYHPVEGWGRLPDGWSFIDATSVAVDNNDRVYVFNRGHHPVIVFDHTGEFVTSWGEGIFATPHAITITAGQELWLTDYADQTVGCFMRDGRLVRTIGQPGVSSPAHSGRPFNMPTDVAESPASGDLFISDGYRNSAVHRFSSDGRHILSWGRPGTRPGQFNIPHNIAVGSDGRVYVADRENHRVQVFDEDGAYLDQINNLHRPCALYAHPKEAAAVRRRAPFPHTGLPGCPEHRCLCEHSHVGRRLRSSDRRPVCRRGPRRVRGAARRCS